MDLVAKFEELKKDEITSNAKKNAERRNKTSTASRKRMLKRRYGLTVEDYNEKLIRQNKLCAICLQSVDYDLYVDHCHTTNKVRDLLCARCNLFVGYLERNENLLEPALSYIDKHKEVVDGKN